ncbi:hypothetical protein B0H21DRAFT_713813 [Amylocystis lapponica]|nr:hypothetical protein B0H21DRAFT_713813 [Amylocystis lapponica]
MAKSYWTKEQNKLINQARPAWNAAEDQPKRTEILEELGKAMGVLTGAPLTKAQLKTHLALSTGCPEEPPESSAEEGKKAKLDYMRNKTWRHVVQEKYKARIDDICKDLSSGDRPGGQKWLGVYQKAVSQAEKDELKAEANRQNREGFLPEEQRKLVVKEGDKIVKKFAEDVFKMLGMRVWVLGAFQAVNGKVNVSCFDNNDSIGNGDLVTDVIKEWDEDSYVELWRRYAATQFLPEQDAGDDSDDDLPKRKKKLPRPEMDLDDEGLPIIPAGTDERFLSMHYVLCCGKANAKVPWAAIQASPKDYIESSHVPRRFVLREPTKMVQDDVDALLAHWRERQADDNCEVTFQFKAYKGSDNRPRKGKGKGNGGRRGKGKAKEKGTRKGKGNGKYHDEETEPSDSAPDSDDPNGWDSARDGSSDEEEEEEDDLGEELEAEDESEVEALRTQVLQSPPGDGTRVAVERSRSKRKPTSPLHPESPAAAVRKEGGRGAYLLGLSQSSVYQACVRSILSMWVNANPTMNRYNEMHVSKAKLELIALTVGMVIHDIEASQFATGDPDEEPEDGSIPPYSHQEGHWFLEAEEMPDAAKEDDDDELPAPPKKTNKRNRPPPKSAKHVDDEDESGSGADEPPAKKRRSGGTSEKKSGKGERSAAGEPNKSGKGGGRKKGKP